jgi:hypothetical protein
MQPFDLRLRHFFGDRMLAVTRQTVNARAHQEVRAQVARFAEQLVNIAFPVANMYASFLSTASASAAAYLPFLAVTVSLP